MKELPKVVFRAGGRSDIKDMNAMGVDIGGDMMFSPRHHYYVAHVKGKLVGFFAIAILKKHKAAFGAGLAVHPDYRKMGIGSALMYMGLMKARRMGVEWVGTTTMYYNFWWFHNRGWYNIPRDKLFGLWRSYAPMFENKKAMCMLRPMGKLAREVDRTPGRGLLPWLEFNRGLLAD